jgi:plastocyanin
MMKLSDLFRFAALSTAVALAACGGTDAPARTTDAAPGAAAAASVQPTGIVHEVGMVSGRGELFEPAEITVQPGDVVRFKLISGVHNASFPASKNPSGIALPEATPYLQIPGQTYDMLIDLPPGEYYYHCDPHAALGMVGTITVVD